MKRVLSGLLHLIELMISAGFLVLSGSIVVSLIAVVPALISSSKFLDDISGNKVKNSIFSVYKNGKIFQNALAHPLRMLAIGKDKDKEKRFTEEALSMFMQMDVRDKKGNLKKYNTKSQAKTLFLLKTLQRHGYIQNLNYEKAGQMHLLVEKLQLGNKKGLDKKHQMYKINFNLTDKDRNIDDLMVLAHLKSEPKNEDKVTYDLSNYEIIDFPKEEQENAVKKEVTKEELLALKEEILASKEAVEEIDNRQR